MQRPRLSLPVLLAFAFACAWLATAVPAHADIYSIQALTGDNSTFFSMDDSGHVVFNTFGNYVTFLNGAFDSSASTPPAFTSDFDAVPCSHPPCSTTRNSRTASITVESDHITDDLNIAAGGPAQLLLQTHGISGKLILNGTGDIVFDNGQSDEWYEAVDLSTIAAPEPASLLLLATGILGLAAFAIRRRSASARSVL